MKTIGAEVIMFEFLTPHEKFFNSEDNFELKCKKEIKADMGSSE